MDLIQYLQERKQVEERDDVVSGYDIPPLESLSDFPIWSEVEPPKGVVYNYPIRPWHNARPSIAAYPAPPEIAVQIYHRAVQPTMFAKLKTLLRKADQRSIAAVWHRIGQLLAAFSPSECQSYFRHAGYASI